VHGRIEEGVNEAEGPIVLMWIGCRAKRKSDGRSGSNPTRPTNRPSAISCRSLICAARSDAPALTTEHLPKGRCRIQQRLALCGGKHATGNVGVHLVDKSVELITRGFGFALAQRIEN